MVRLRRAARSRKKAAYRPGTRANHRTQVTSYLKFCISNDLQFVDPSTDTLCLYTEFLAQKFTSAKSVRNYLSAISFYHNVIGIPASNLGSFDYRLMQRALPLTMRAVPLQRLPMDPPLLRRICDICDHIGVLGTILKCAFLLSFFGFLRQSNLAPTSASFDVTRHTTRDDVWPAPPGLLIRLKWSKTLQSPGDATIVPIPSIPGHPLDPVAAFQAMVAGSPTTHGQSPLLVHPRGRVITTRHLQSSLRSILTSLGVPAHLYSLHSLRRGGATTSALAGADYLHIKRHGTWRSDSFWDYIAAHAHAVSPVATALASAVKNNSWTLDSDVNLQVTLPSVR